MSTFICKNVVDSSMLMEWTLVAIKRLSGTIIMNNTKYMHRYTYEVIYIHKNNKPNFFSTMTLGDGHNKSFNYTLGYEVILINYHNKALGPDS